MPVVADFEDVGLIPPRIPNKQNHLTQAYSTASVRLAFDDLYKQLAVQLEIATTLGKTDDQLALLDAWAFVLDAKDHSLLSGCKLFQTLQTVLDVSRTRLNLIKADNVGFFCLSRV